MPFKLYVDSRFREDVPGASDCDFKVQLPHPIVVSGKAFVDVCLVPNTFNTIRANDNDRFYIREGTIDYRVCLLSPGQYDGFSLATALANALNFQSGFATAGHSYTVQYLADKNKLQIANSSPNPFYVYSIQSLLADPGSWNIGAQAAGRPTIDPKNLMHAHSVCGYYSGHTLTSSSLDGYDMINTLPYQQLFLRSSLGEGYDAIGPDGSSDIIRRITVGVPQNGMIQDLHGLPFDSVTVGKNREINSLKFRLTDVFGKPVDSNGHAISFSIIFIDDD